VNIGIDIVEVNRIAKLIKSKAFLRRVFTAQEIAYCSAKKNKAQHFAVRFAAKEAVYKALGQAALSLTDIGVKNQPSGKPEVYIRGKRESDIAISLTHTDLYAAAVALNK
jgi:holo-[acyl-carrier protein] synthase